MFDTGKNISYEYDSLNRLTKETNLAIGSEWRYTYDNGGNITRKEEYNPSTGALVSSRDYGYGDAVKTIGPRFRSMEVLDGGVVRVHFDGSDCGFLIKGEIVGFELAGSDGVFRPAKAVRRRPDPTVLYVSNYDVGNPVYLRYNFKNCSVGRLWDAFGQPVVPFRTDNF